MRKCSVHPSAPFAIISKGYAPAHFPQGNGTVTLQRPGKSNKWYPTSYETRDRRVYKLTRQWLDFVRDNLLQEGDICMFILMKGGKRFTFTVYILHKPAEAHIRAGTVVQRVGLSHGKTTTKKALVVHIKEEPTNGYVSSSESDSRGGSLKSLESKDSDGPPEPSYILSVRCSLSQLQKKIVEEKVKAIVSEVPIYVAIMNNGYEKLLEFGAQYARLHLPGRNQSVVLQCMGKIWKTKMVIHNGNRRLLSGGWSKFVRDSGLQVGDICLFELKKNKRPKLTMIVHIISQ